MLLVLFAVIGHDKDKSDRGGLALYNVLQITFTIEFVLCVPGILWYLGMEAFITINNVTVLKVLKSYDFSLKENDILFSLQWACLFDLRFVLVCLKYPG